MSEFDIRQGDNLLLLRAMADASVDRDSAGQPLGYVDIIRARCEWALLERAREAEVRAVADREADFRAKQIALFGAAA